MQAVDGFLEGMCQAAPDNDIMIRFRDGHLLVLKALADPRVYGHNWTSKQVTRGLIESREECRYNPEAVDLLIRNHLLNLQAYDLHLTQVKIICFSFLYLEFFVLPFNETNIV